MVLSSADLHLSTVEAAAATDGDTVPSTPEPDPVLHSDRGLASPINAAEQAIFQMFVHHRAVPVEQRNAVRAQLDRLAAEDGVRIGYQVLAAATRKWVKRLGKSPTE